MKSNYIAWDVNVDDFYKKNTEAEKIKFLLKFAVLAPSSHNTQPWQFSVRENKIHIFRDNKRKLVIADKNDRQLFISIGCAIENLVIAANYYGYSIKIDYHEDNSNIDLAAILELEQIGAARGNERKLITSILSRRTNRGKYKNNEKINSGILKEIMSLNSEDVKIHVVDQVEQISKLGEVAVMASVESMVDAMFRQELSQHVKHNLTNSKIGMPGFSQGIPTPISFLLSTLIKKFNLEKASEKQNKILFTEYTPYIIIISTNQDSREVWLKAGQIFQRIALIFNNYSISTSPWGAPIEISSFYKNIQEILNIDGRPQIFFRAGYPMKPAKTSPRIPHHELIK